MNQRSQRRGLARAGRSRQQNQTFGHINQIHELFRQVEFLNRLDAFGDQSKGRADAVALHEYVCAKPAHALERVTKIEIPVFFEVLALRLVQDLKDQALARLW